MVKQDNWYFNAQTIFLLVIVNRYATQAHRSFRFLSFFPYLEYFDMLFLTQERGKKNVWKNIACILDLNYLNSSNDVYIYAIKPS